MPFINQIARSPLALRHKMSHLPSPLKSPVATTDHVVGITPSVTALWTCRPFISQIARLPLLSRQRISALPSPLKSAVPTMDQLVGTLPRLADCAISSPSISQIATVPVELSRQSRSCLPSPLKSRWPASIQLVGIVPRPLEIVTCAPLISHSAVLPVLSRQAISLMPLPLKSWAAARSRKKAHTAPVLLLSNGPPTMAVLPSADSATEKPCVALPTAPLPTSFCPCCVHTPLLGVNTHAAPAPLSSIYPPTMAVLPSADSATDQPCAALPTAPLPTSFCPCCVHTPLLRVNTHAAPAKGLSNGPPTMAVLPSADSATERPCCAAPMALLPTSLLPCCDHTPLLRVNIHAAPASSLSNGPPTMAVLPSADSATE